MFYRQPTSFSVELLKHNQTNRVCPYIYFIVIWSIYYLYVLLLNLFKKDRHKSSYKYEKWDLSLLECRSPFGWCGIGYPIFINIHKTYKFPLKCLFCVSGFNTCGNLGTAESFCIPILWAFSGLVVMNIFYSLLLMLLKSSEGELSMRYFTS
jgi:hypothetical protein